MIILFSLNESSSQFMAGWKKILIEKKNAPPDIARQTGYSLEAVDRYISDYERVKMLLKRGANPKEISQLIGRGLRTVKQYQRIAIIYHPELVSDKEQVEENNT
jgi:hypothetical protein